jgi:hypothetical protein
MSSTTVVHGKRLASVDPNPHFRGRVVRSVAGLAQDINDELRDRYAAPQTRGFVVIWLGDNGVESLVVEVDKDGVGSLQDAVDGSVVKVQEAERPAMTCFTF